MRLSGGAPSATPACSKCTQSTHKNVSFAFSTYQQPLAFTTRINHPHSCVLSFAQTNLIPAVSCCEKRKKDKTNAPNSNSHKGGQYLTVCAAASTHQSPNHTTSLRSAKITANSFVTPSSTLSGSSSLRVSDISAIERLIPEPETQHLHFRTTFFCHYTECPFH